MKTLNYIFLTLLALLPMTSPNKAAETVVVQNLRCEYLKNPLGVDVANPRLSWVLESNQRGQKQTTYRILVATSRENLNKNIGDAWDSGKVQSSQSVHNYYAGIPLQSDKTFYWKVQVWDKEDKPSPWSEPAFWSTGLLDESDWKAKWIGLDKAVGDDDPDAEHRRLSARMLRHEFKIKKKIKRATAFVCGLGLFELYINGEKIRDQVLSPGLTEYNKRAFYMTFDVTDQLRHENNAVGVILGNGRYFAPRGEKPTKTRTYGYPKLRLQINVRFEDGTKTTIISDEKWRLTTDGPIRANCEYDGEIYDARKEVDNWNESGFDDSAWRDVELVEKPGEKIVAQMNEPIKIMETIQPVSVSEPQPGVYIFDMGQNMVGWVRLTVKGKRGTKVSLKFAEVLKDDGMLFMENIRGAKVTDIYILKGGSTETWEPRFTYHGFRYVEVKGFPGKPDLSAIEGKVVYDAVENSGTFSCSNPLVNRIYKNAYWGIGGNYRSIPTDCPQRDERQGWLGDRSVESKGESYIFDIVKLYNKWLVDIQDAQLENGSIPNVAPSYWPMYSDNTTWPGSYIIIPAMLYDQYGDMETLRKHYPTMKKWINHMSQYIQDGIMPRDTYGDWCVPPEDLKLIHSNDPNRRTSGEFIGTAYFSHELKLMGRFARLLNKPAEADYFENLAAQMKEAFNERFLNKSPLRYSNNSQTSNVLPLAFGLVPDEYKERIFENLVVKIMGESDGHIGTGLIGCQWLMRVLTENGRPDIAYALAAQHTYPSWGYMVEHGATTIWELWNGDTGDPAMNSHNHVMLLGDLIIWFYENLAGIKPDPEQPAFKHLIMRPQVVGDIDYVRASYNSMHGPINSEWKIQNNKFYWDFSIPANTTATVYVPAGDENVVRESGLAAAESNGVHFVRWGKNRAVYHVDSGHYSFTSEGFKIMTPEPFVSTPVISPKDTSVAIPGKISVSIKCKTPDAKLRYTLDGSEPDETSAVYERPFSISNSTVVKAKVFKTGFHPSIVKSTQYDFVDPQKNGVRWELYEGAFTRLPDFDKLKPVKSGRVFQIDLTGMEILDEYFALVFSGFIEITHEEKYTFYTNSNDGSQLFISNKLVVDNDGEHGPTERSGHIKLSPGMYPIKVTYFQAGASKVLNVFYKWPGFERRIVPGSVLYFANEEIFGPKTKQ